MTESGNPTGPRYPSGTGSVAAIAGHPLHPMVVALPIGALVFALAADIAYLVTENPFWAQGAAWLLLAVLMTGALAAVLGLIDLLSLPRARTMGIAIGHGVGNLMVLAITLVNYLLRIDQVAGEPMLSGFILTVVAVALAGLTGWLGGEMSFRHGIGVSPSIGGAADPDTARR